MKYILGQRFEHEQIWYSGFNFMLLNVAVLLHCKQMICIQSQIVRRKCCDCM